MRVRSKVLAAAAAVMALAGLAVTLLSASPAASARSQRVTQRVIVVFKNQGAAGHSAARHSLAARRQSFAVQQRPILSELSRSHAHNVRSYSIINAVSATVSPAEAAALKANKTVKQVVPDAYIHLTSPHEALASGRTLAGGSLAGAGAPSGGARAHVAPGGGGGSRASVCSADKSNPQLTPEALSLMHADSQSSSQTARKLGIDGSGVKVGYIADGLDPNNPDFIRNGKSIFVDYKDFSGEGATPSHPTGGEEAFGDASAIAAQGNTPYNVANYGPDAVTKPCWIKVEGVAPGANLVGLDVFGAEDAGYNSTFLNAINYAVTVDHVNVLNESLGSNPYPDDQANADLIKSANDNATLAGVTVTASSGDAGYTSTVGSPATDPNVISVGAATSYQIDLQTGYGGAQFPGITGYASNDISSFSSSGFEQDGRTIDVVSSGELNWALCSTNTKVFAECTSYAGKPTPVVPFGGTSQSSPLTAGEAALVEQAYYKTHGTYPSAAVVKQIITGTADDIDSPADQQGAGYTDAYKAVQAAESYKAPGTTPTPAGANVLKSDDQLNAVDQPGTQERLTDTITNGGASTQTYQLSSRALGAYTQIASTKLVLSDASSPKTVDFVGAQSNYAPTTFTVAKGQSRLQVNAAWTASQLNDPSLLARVRVTLVDPNGKLAAYSVPQGDGNYSDVQVTDPTPGKWTAYVWSKTAANGGTTGPVLFRAQTAQYGSFGSVSPSSVTLAPGQSRQVTLNVTTPAQPGDSSGSIVVQGGGPSFGARTTIPVTLRSQIPSGPQSFGQTLTGGNGRGATTGQEFYYQLDVGANQPALNASVQLADNPNNPFTLILVDPNGHAEATASNGQFNSIATPQSVTNQLGAQAHVLNPAQGAWTVIVAFIPTVSGTALSEPFTVSTDQSANAVSASGLPNSGSTALPAGKPVTVPVTVKNTGQSPERYFVDGRLSGQQTQQLGALDPGNGVTQVPFKTGNNVPTYLVPTDSTAWTESATTSGSIPIEFDSSPATGDPDIGSTVGKSPIATLSANPIAQGEWSIVPDVTGAYDASHKAAKATVTTSMFATFAPLDPAVTSPTGDLWAASTNPDALNGLTPVTVQPGQTATIPVTITPTGKSGTQVSGTLYVDGFNDVILGAYSSPNGDQVAGLPYSYTIK